MNDKKIEEILKKEHLRQERELNLIASENYTSINCMQASASVLTNKYAEGYAGKRYYGGCEMVDEAELLAIERCKQLFNAEHVNVQAHAGSQANMAVYHALLNAGDTILAMSLAHGGHLTHGHKVNFSGKLYSIVHYGVDTNTECIDYDQMATLALEHKPKLIVLGASAYSRTIDFKRAKEIADSVGAFLMADIAHIAGLVAAKLHPNPFPYADVVTSTTHKTLRGPRGGLIMCKKELAQAIDRSIMPGTQGGPFMHMIAAKAVAFYEALQSEFVSYQKHVIENAQTLSQELKAHGFRIVADGTDNHLMIVDLRSKSINGLEAEKALNAAGITVSRSCIPNDPEKPWITSGIRLGTPAITTRGMKKEEVKQIAWFINQAIEHADNPAKLTELNRQVGSLCAQFPIYTQTFVPQDLTYSQAQL